MRDSVREPVHDMKVIVALVLFGLLLVVLGVGSLIVLPMIVHREVSKVRRRVFNLFARQWCSWRC